MHRNLQDAQTDSFWKAKKKKTQAHGLALLLKSGHQGQQIIVRANFTDVRGLVPVGSEQGRRQKHIAACSLTSTRVPWHKQTISVTLKKLMIPVTVTMSRSGGKVLEVNLIYYIYF